MATFKTANALGKYHDQGARMDVIQYILRPDKAIHGYVGGSSVDMNDQLRIEMLVVLVWSNQAANSFQDAGLLSHFELLL